MYSSVFETTVNLLTIEEFIAEFPNYSSWVLGKGKAIFDAVMSPEGFVRIRFATEIGLPGASGVAALCDDVAKAQGFELKGDRFSKQAIGILVLCVMRINGYEKTGTHKAISHVAFSRGTVYQLKEKTT